MYTFNARLLQATRSWQALTNKGTKLNYPPQLTSVKNTVQIMQTVNLSTYKTNVEFLLYCRTAKLQHKMEVSVVPLVVTHNKQLTKQSIGLLHKLILGQFLENLDTHAASCLHKSPPIGPEPADSKQYPHIILLSRSTFISQFVPRSSKWSPLGLRISDLPNK
jgi:hypothetical protein